MTPPAATERRLDELHVAVDRQYATVIYDNEGAMVCQLPLGLSAEITMALITQVRISYARGLNAGRTILQHELRTLLQVAPMEPGS